MIQAMKMNASLPKKCNAHEYQLAVKLFGNRRATFCQKLGRYFLSKRIRGLLAPFVRATHMYAHIDLFS